MHHENHDTGGCTKCIINPPIMAQAADLLASLTSGAVSATATKLATAARALSGTYDSLVQHGAIVPTKAKTTTKKTATKTATKPAWDGCDEAKTLWSWIAEARTDADAFVVARGEEVITQMHGWLTAIDAQGYTLAAGE